MVETVSDIAGHPVAGHFAGLAIRVVEPGHEIPNPEGGVFKVEKGCAVASLSNLFMVQEDLDALCAKYGLTKA